MTKCKFTITPCSTKGFSLIQWNDNGLRSLQVETPIALLWASAPELLEVTKELVNQLLTFRAEMRERFVNIGNERTNLISAVLQSASEIVPKAEGRK